MNPDHPTSSWAAAHPAEAKIVDTLNSYTGENIWQDVILLLEYDEAATAEVDSAHTSDQFVVEGVLYAYDYPTAAWICMGNYSRD